MTTVAERTPRRRTSARATLERDATDEDRTAVVLNATAYAIWELCDGETTVAEMLEAATTIFDAAEDTIAADLERILSELHELRLITWTPKAG